MNLSPEVEIHVRSARRWFFLSFSVKLPRGTRSQSPEFRLTISRTDVFGGERGRTVD